MLRVIGSLLLLALLAGCDGKSDVVAEVVPFEKICSYEKWKNVSFEGYFGLKQISCKGMKSRRTGSTSTNECSLAVYGTPREAGPPVLAWIDSVDGDKKFNKIVPPPQTYSAADLKIYDNEEKLIPLDAKIRVTGKLRKHDTCQMDVVRLDVVK